ncbi:hypothetical protein D9V76_02735 [Buchnera aphidicola (Rhopalosiphum padi)]|uniref:Uncharacterized protein n=1 Tax=Buchnera aphidicola subsp. Rhopalosiphum padi TaxID=98793 RepID=A0A4D6Y779_BUCRP|nr:hypothetical protein [Buchnera aphidicola]QCI25152.1 hypothetical protein D9V76_02735 [Buchnera aphidicola (Rhopalosiphum padi)]
MNKKKHILRKILDTQKKDINEIKEAILLYQMEIINIQKKMQELSKKLNYITLCVNRLSKIQLPPHY